MSRERHEGAGQNRTFRGIRPDYIFSECCNLSHSVSSGGANETPALGGQREGIVLHKQTLKGHRLARGAGLNNLLPYSAGGPMQDVPDKSRIWVTRPSSPCVFARVHNPEVGFCRERPCKGIPLIFAAFSESPERPLVAFHLPLA